MYVHFIRIKTVNNKIPHIGNETVFMIWSHSSLTTVCSLSNDLQKGLRSSFIDRSTVLRLLDYSFNNVKIIDNYCFLTHSFLQVLYLNNNNLLLLKPFAFKGIVSLQKLDISNNYLITLYSVSLKVIVLNIINTEFHTNKINPLLSSVSKIMTTDHLVCCLMTESNSDCLGVQLVSLKCQLVKRTLAIKILTITSAVIMTTLILYFHFLEGKRSARSVRKSDKYVVSNILLSIITVTDLVKTVTTFSIIMASVQNVTNYNSELARLKKHFICKFLGFTSAFSFTHYLLLVNLWTLYRLIAVKYPLNKYLKDLDIFKLITLFCSLFCALMSIMCSIGYHIVEDRDTMPSEVCMYVGESFTSVTLRFFTLFQSTMQIGTFLSTLMFHFFMLKEIKKSNFVKFNKSIAGKVRYQAMLVCVVNASCLVPSSVIYVTSVLVKHFPLHVLLWTTVLVHLLVSLMNPVAHLSLPLIKKKLQRLVIKMLNP